MINNMNDAFMDAVRDSDLVRMQELLDQGTDIHANDEAALRQGASLGDLPVVRFLVERGADIHANNNSALVSSARLGHFPVVQYLTEHGAHIHADDDAALMGVYMGGSDWRMGYQRGDDRDLIRYIIAQDLDYYRNHRVPEISNDADRIVEEMDTIYEIPGLLDPTFNRHVQTYIYPVRAVNWRYRQRSRSARRRQR